VALGALPGGVLPGTTVEAIPPQTVVVSAGGVAREPLRGNWCFVRVPLGTRPIYLYPAGAFLFRSVWPVCVCGSRMAGRPAGLPHWALRAQ